jgi:hypothetical protein
MEQLAILETIYNNLSASLEPGTPIYIFAAAIYDTWWIKGSELEQNIAKRLINLWEKELIQILDSTYTETPYQGYHDSCKKWIEDNYIKYKDSIGIRRALQNIWEKKGYGFKLWSN